MINVGKLVVKPFLNKGIILGTVIGFHEVSGNKYAKIMWMTHNEHPVSISDFYHDFTNLANLNKTVFILDNEHSIPNHLLPPN